MLYFTVLILTINNQHNILDFLKYRLTKNVSAIKYYTHTRFIYKAHEAQVITSNEIVITHFKDVYSEILLYKIE